MSNLKTYQDLVQALDEFEWEFRCEFKDGKVLILVDAPDPRTMSPEEFAQRKKDAE